MVKLCKSKASPSVRLHNSEPDACSAGNVQSPHAFRLNSPPAVFIPHPLHLQFPYSPFAFLLVFWCLAFFLFFWSLLKFHLICKLQEQIFKASASPPGSTECKLKAESEILCNTTRTIFIPLLASPHTTSSDPPKGTMPRPGQVLICIMLCMFWRKTTHPSLKDHLEALLSSRYDPFTVKTSNK